MLQKSLSNAFLTTIERRALLEDIGQVALSLGRSLSDTSDDFAVVTEEASFSVSSALTARSESITSPLERLHLLVMLWSNLESPLRVLLNQPNSQSISAEQKLPLARSPGSPEAAHRIARTPRTALAWQHLMKGRIGNVVQNSPAANEFPPDSNFSSHSDFSSNSTFPAEVIGLHNATDLAEPLHGDASAWQPAQTPIITPITTLTQDTWPNRLVVTLLIHIAHEASALRQLAVFCDLPSEAEEADRLIRLAQRYRRHPALHNCPELSEAEQTQHAAGENIVRCAPAYRAIYQIWRALHRPLDFDWTHSPLLTLPALEPWRLYEIWCYLQVGAALLRSGRQLRDGGSLLRCTSRGMQLMLTPGRLSRLQFTASEVESAVESEVEGPGSPDYPDSESLSLYYQPLFVSANQNQGNRKIECRRVEKQRVEKQRTEKQRTEKKRPKAADAEFAFCSRSHAMQPDMALYAKGRLILLDPKFKRFAQTEEAQEDIDKMHTYSDAIVTVSDSSGLPVAGQQAVAAAWCLFPGICEGQKPESPASEKIYAYPATSAASPYGTAGVGAFLLRPGQPDTASRLTEFLTTLLQEI